MVRKILLCIFACTFVMSEAQEESVRPYQLPDIPDSLVTPDVRSEYLIAHYWDNFDIENRAYLDAKGKFRNRLSSILPLLCVSLHERVH